MTTLKELKEIDAKATSGPWVLYRRAETTISTQEGRGICSTGGYSDNTKDPDELLAENKANAELIAATRNALPDLIRMIELAEEAISYGIKALTLREDSNIDHLDLDAAKELKQALSEIRMLKGG